MTGFQSTRLVIFVFPNKLSILNVFLKSKCRFFLGGAEAVLIVIMML